MKLAILYLDDDDGCLSLFEHMFGDTYDVRVAATPGEARRMLAERAADIIISDQSMPEIEGTEFLREVAATYPASYRVMLTGTAAVGNVLREIGTGVINLFITKPWTEEHMRQSFERAGIAAHLRRNSSSPASADGKTEKQ
jgi:DNA-binding NtrC family response regulator